MSERLGRAVLELATEGNAALLDVLDKIDKKASATGNTFRKTGSDAQGFGTQLKSLVGPLTAVLSVTAVIGAVKAYTDFTSSINDMSEKTGIGTEALQRLKYAAEQNGASLEQVTGAVTKLGQKLAGGDKSALGALDALNLSFDKIRQMQPDQAFTTIGDAIAKIEDPMARSKLALDLFGKAGAELLPMMTGHLTETMAAADRLGIVMSDDMVRAGDAFGDQMTTLSAVGKGMIAQAIGPMIPALTELATWMGEHLPRAIQFTVDALQIGLPRAFMEAKIQIFELFVQAAELAQKLPTLRNLFGKSAEDTAHWKGQLQQAKDQLMLFDQQTSKVIASQGKAARTIATLNLNYDGLEKKVTAAGKALDAAAKFTEDWEASKRKDREELMRMDIWLTKFNASLGVTGDELLEATEKMMKLGQVISQMPIIVIPGGFEDVLEPFKEAVEAQGPELGSKFGEGFLHGLDDVFSAQNIGDTFARSFEGGGGIGGALKSLAVQFGQAIIKSVQQAMQMFGAGVRNAVAAGTGIAGAFGGAVGGQTGALIGSVASGIAGVALSTTSLATSAVALGAATAGIGAAAVGVYMLIKHFAGVSKEVKEARKAVEGFQEKLHETLNEQQRAEAGGEKWKMTLIAVRDAYLAMGKSAEEAEAIVQQLWDTDHPARARAAVAAIGQLFAELGKRQQEAATNFNDLIAVAKRTGERLPESFRSVIDSLVQMKLLTEEQAAALRELTGSPTWQQMEESAKALGIDLAYLGNAFDSKKLASSAEETLRHLNTLRAGGMDVGTMLDLTTDKLREMVQRALVLGTTLPEGLKEYLKNLADSGKLVDENGEALTDLSRLNFAEPLEKSVDRLIKKFEELVNFLVNGVAPALINLPAPNIPSPNAPTLPEPGYAYGTLGRTGGFWKDFGRGLRTTLHGLEAVVTPSQAVPFAQSVLGAGGAGMAQTPLILQVGEDVLARVLIRQTGRTLSLVGV